MGKVNLQQNLRTRLAMAAKSSPGVCLTPWLDVIEQGELSKKDGQEAISRLLNRRCPAAGGNEHSGA
jgi:hypothetical protein